MRIRPLIMEALLFVVVSIIEFVWLSHAPPPHLQTPTQSNVKINFNLLNFVSSVSDSIPSCLRTINTFLVPVLEVLLDGFAKLQSPKLAVYIIQVQKRAVFIADLIYILLLFSRPHAPPARREPLQAILLFMDTPFQASCGPAIQTGENATLRI